MLAYPSLRFAALTLVFATGLLASPRQSGAALIVEQTQNFSLTGTTVHNLTWNQFDPSLGTLTNVLYSVNGVLSGSFNVTNSNLTETADVSESRNRFSTQFQGAGAPALFLGPQFTPIATTPPSGDPPFGGSTIAANTMQQFVISTDPEQVMEHLDVPLFGSAAYFTGLGTVSQNLSQSPAVTVTGANVSLDMGGVMTDGTATLIYVYETTVIPEPLSVAFSGLLIGGGALVQYRRKRRTTKLTAKA